MFYEKKAMDDILDFLIKKSNHLMSYVKQRWMIF